MIYNNQKQKSNGAPPKAAPVFLIILYHKHLWIFLIHTIYIYIYIPYIFPEYVPYMFPCVFLNLFSQQYVRTWPNDDCWSNFAHFWVQDWLFEDMSGWFCMALRGEAQKKHKKRELKLKNIANILKITWTCLISYIFVRLFELLHAKPCRII